MEGWKVDLTFFDVKTDSLTAVWKGNETNEDFGRCPSLTDVQQRKKERKSLA